MSDEYNKPDRDVVPISVLINVHEKQRLSSDGRSGPPDTLHLIVSTHQTNLPEKKTHSSVTVRMAKLG
eukprot:COSAG02_NODE_61591_length_268_cov_0.615385_1_plen_67_part_10